MFGKFLVASWCLQLLLVALCVWGKQSPMFIIGTSLALAAVTIPVAELIRKREPSKEFE